jgi:hypothetical protein
MDVFGAVLDALKTAADANKATLEPMIANGEISIETTVFNFINTLKPSGGLLAALLPLAENEVESAIKGELAKMTPDEQFDWLVDVELAALAKHFGG